DCSWPNPPWSTFLFRSLLENEDFAGKFIERFNTYTNTHFARDRYYATINEMQNHLAAEIPRHIERWGGQRVDNPDNTWTHEVFNSFEEWDANIQVMRDFVGLRHEIAIQQLNDYFGIEGTRRLKLFNTDSTGSTLMLGNTPLYDSAFSGNYSTNTEIEISVVIDPGFKFTHWDRVSYSPIDSILIIKGDEWKYNDEGQRPNGEWTQLDYDDTSWGTGFAEFGYGDGDENTVVAYGPDPNNKYITTYFRKAFSIQDTVNVETYELQIKRDDAAMVFLNGKQVVKENMPQYGHNYTTNAVATVSGDDEDRYLIFNLNPKLFVKGENIIAVEIHQAGAGSSDISFDLQLKATSMRPGDITEITSETVVITMNDNYGLTAHVIPDKNVLENVFINEICASNIDRFADEAGDYEDWIEIYNIGDEAVNLAGYYLADSVPVIKKWMFPVEYESATTIPPDSFIVVFADEEPLEGLLHANFRLSGDGEEVILLLIANEDTTIIDHVIFDKQYNNVSWGRYPDGAEEFQFMPENTPWYSNFWEPLDTTSVTEVVGMQFTLYPNPTKSVFYIDLGGLVLPGEIGVRVYSFTGREVLRTHNDVSERIELSLEGHAPGLYLVELEISGQRLVRKLIVE
ncbi:MAG: lamin tail domain-containing protein, partial [Bacteroidales bacterium]|nr:lamin tail domain-containing protein [Bacteroidales bacterium]